MHPYSGISAALTTKHGKQEHIAEPLRELGITLSTVEYDTDLNSALFKGIADLDSLRSAITTILKSGDIAVIENDLRAHLNPQRQRAINEVAKRLVARLKELCVNCGTPGWGVVSLLKGLPCENCQHFNAEYPAGEIKGCARCDY
ncbi:MAG: hypothetical protein EBX75_03740, partial [Actinobacteria bacterium]|nr:hypothetical protein [Actinomycetota bacterium]